MIDTWADAWSPARRLARAFLPALALILACGLAPQSAGAADALHGKTLYQNGPSSGGASCASCHGPTPANNVNGILAAANQPSVIAAAIAGNLGGMGSLFNGKLSSADLADLAAYIGNPSVVAAPAASLAPSSLTFSGTGIGQLAGPLAATLSNTGNAALNIVSVNLGGAAAADFTVSGGSCAAGAAVAAGASCTVQASFRPTAAGARAATLTISHNAAGGASTVTLSGTGNSTPQPTIALSAASVNFGALLTGSASGVATLTVSNSGQAALTFSAISVSGANAASISRGGTCAVAVALAAGASCTVTLQALPVAAGGFSALLTLDSNASNGSAAVSLTGSATAPAPAISATPSALAFGAQTLAAPAVTQTVTLQNTGNVALNFTSIALNGTGAGTGAGAGAGAFTLGAHNCGATLAPGTSCAVPVRFAPTVAGAASASLAVTSNAAPLQVGITGSGATQPVAAPSLSEAGPVGFADTQVGASTAAHVTTLSNGGNAALTIATLTLAGNQPGDFTLGGSCAAGGQVGPGASCTLASTFKPAAAGARAADLLLVTDGGAQFHLALTGNGVAVAAAAPSLTVAPQSVDFGAVGLGASASHRFALTNSGAAPLALSGASFSGPFAIVAASAGDSGACAAFPFTLAPGASCELVLQYAPVNAGGSSGSAVIQASAGGASWSIALAGQATAAVTPVQAPRANAGGGGCSAAQDGNDPMLALLAVAAALVIAWRRRQRIQHPSPSTDRSAA